MKKQSNKFVDKRSAAPLTTRSATRSMVSNTTAKNVVRHNPKVIVHKTYEINAPETPTVDITQNEHNLKMPATSKPKTFFIPNSVKSNEAPKLVKCASEDFLFGKSQNTASPVSLEYEVVNIEVAEKEDNSFVNDLVGDELVSVENDCGEKVQNDDETFTEFNDDEDSDDLLNEHYLEMQSRIPKCIDKEQTIKFGTRIRPPPRKRCGIVECFTNNSTFCLTCSFCSADFELWDWQQFIEHIHAEHIPRHQHYIKNKNKLEDSLDDELQNIFNTDKLTTEEPVQEDEFLTPKLEECDEQEEDVEMALENNEHLFRGNIESDIQEEETIENFSNKNENNVDLYDEEDWQVDKLEDDEDVEIFEDHASNVDDVDIDDEEYDDEEVGDDEEENEEMDEDEEEDETEGDNNDENSISKAVINFKTTDPTRVLAFLKLLREQPVLWHPRRYGPPVYDEEVKTFLNKFDNTMSMIDFRRSVGHLRHQYKRFTPITPRGRAKLQQDDYLRECVQIIKEIADKLSVSFVFQCDICRYSFLDKDRMLTHKYVKHKIGDLKYICSCSTRFAYERQKEEHEKLHKQKPRFTCKLCNANFVFKRLLRDHMNEFHPETQENPLPYACSKCDAKFPSIAKRGHHMQTHKIPQYHCEICNQSFKTSFRFRHHMKRHQDERDWVCEHCGKAFVEKRSLTAHLFRMHGESGVKCVHCRTYYTNQDGLDAHNRKFHPEGTNLDRMKIRSKRIKRKSRSKNVEPKRTYQCKKCGESFPNVWSLVGHKRQTGHNLQVYNCPNCEAVLSNPKSLMGHMRRIHKLPIATMSELRNLLLQTFEEEQLTGGEEEAADDVDDGPKFEEIEVFEAYDIE